MLNAYLAKVEHKGFFGKLAEVASMFVHPIESCRQEFGSGETLKRESYNGSKFPLSAFDKDRLLRIREFWQAPNLQFSDIYDSDNLRVVFHKLVLDRRNENLNISMAMKGFNFALYNAFHPSELIDKNFLKMNIR